MNELPLKQYQARALDSFRNFMRRCGNLEDIKNAFYQTTEEAFGFPCEYHAIDGTLSSVHKSIIKIFFQLFRCHIAIFANKII